MDRDWWSLTDEEAEVIFDSYLASHEGYVNRFIADRAAGRCRGGDRLDLTMVSLKSAWVWHLEDIDRPVRWRSRRRSGTGWLEDAPYWAKTMAPLSEPLGLAACWQINDLAAYFLETARRASPESDWGLETGEASADFNQPVLRVVGGGTLRASQVLVLTRHALGLKGPRRVPDKVDALYNLVAPSLGAASSTR